MKKISLLFATLVMIMLFSLTAGAASESDLTFKLNADRNSYYVADCDGSAKGALVIPSTYNGKAVTSIGNSAFYGCESLTSIEIPDSVTSIGYSAFQECYNLTSIEIPDSVTSIGNQAFCRCESLTSIEIPDSVTSIGYAAFNGCESLTSITVDKNNQYYCNDDYGALYDKNKTVLIQYPDGNTRTAYTIPDSVTSIDDSAFSGCESLQSITIPDSVTSIGGSAFSGCTSLASITIPDSVITIAAGAFSGCESLQSITIPDSVTSIGGYETFGGCRSLESITIGNSVTYIGTLVFSDCTSLKSVTIPDSVTSIDDSAFYNCTSLESVTIPDSVASIGYQAFYCCESLQAVYFGGTEKKWDEITSGNNDESLNNATIFLKDGVRCKKHTDEDHDGYCDICKEMTPERANCSCNCHKSGFMGIIWKILRFFYKLFGTNKTCGCGVAHY